jgi:anthranilate synthase component 1
MHDPVRQSVVCDAGALLGLHRLKPERYPALLASSATAGAFGRYDILFCQPTGALVKDQSGRLSAHGEGLQLSDGFLGTLDRWWQRERRDSDRIHDLPFAGGWFVFLGYEIVTEIEPSLALPSSPDPIAAMALRIPAAVIHDRLHGRTEIVAEAEHAAVVGEIVGDLARIAAPPPLVAFPVHEVAEDDPVRHLRAIARTKEHIAAGDIYQANLSREWRARLDEECSSADLFARLCATNPGGFAGLAVLGPQTIVSSSPERLISIRGGIVSTRPIAGTRPRAADRSADAADSALLVAHPKERAEHIMLIDLERNDLGRVCEAGTVEVDELMVIESYAHVHHIVSNVRGRLRAEVSPIEAVRAVFPGGTITGVPKVRCMQIIAEVEGQGRGAYTGTMGYLNRDGSCDFNILIRTMVRQGAALRFRAGGGIVADSIPERELEETRAKARGLLRALDSDAAP